MSGPSAHNGRDARASKKLRSSLLPHLVDDYDNVVYSSLKGKNMRKLLILPLATLVATEVHATWTPEWVFDELWARQERKSEENDDDLRSPRIPKEPSETGKELEEERKRIFDLYKQLDPPTVPKEPSRKEITPEKPENGDKK